MALWWWTAFIGLSIIMGTVQPQLQLEVHGTRTKTNEDQENFRVLHHAVDLMTRRRPQPKDAPTDHHLVPKDLPSIVRDRRAKELLEQLTTAYQFPTLAVAASETLSREPEPLALQLAGMQQRRDEVQRIAQDNHDDPEWTDLADRMTDEIRNIMEQGKTLPIVQERGRRHQDDERPVPAGSLSIHRDSTQSAFTWKLDNQLRDPSQGPGVLRPLTMDAPYVMAKHLGSETSDIPVAVSAAKVAEQWHTHQPTTIPVSALPVPETNRSRHWRTFSGYDCTDPVDIQVIRPALASTCKKYWPTLVAPKQVRYRLVQENPFSSFPARRCSHRTSKFPFYCGMHSHASLATHDIVFDVPVEVGEAKCRGWHDHKIYHARSRTTADRTSTMKVELQANATNMVRYNSFGETVYWEDDITCQGTHWWSEAQGVRINDMVEYTNDQVTLKDETLLRNPRGILSVFDDQTTLPRHCKARDGRCVLEDATWVWDPPAENLGCRIYLAEELTGYETTILNEGQPMTIFVDDEQLVRLQKKAEVVRCSRRMFATNVDSLYLAPITDSEPASEAEFYNSRPVDALNVEMATYFDVKTTWLANHLQDKIHAVVQATAHEFCENNQKANTRDFARLAAEQGAQAEGSTISLGNGQFATATGESWTTYQCHDMTVTGLDLDQCYDSLPVQPAPLDLEDLNGREMLRRRDLIDHGLAEEDDFEPLDTIQYYLEPHTHRLTTLANLVECIPAFTPYYQNSNQDWVIVSPFLRQVSAPRMLSPVLQVPWGQTSGNRSEIDFANRGPYRAHTMRQLAAKQLMPRQRQRSVVNMTPLQRTGTTTSAAARRYFREDFEVADVGIAAYVATLQTWVFSLGYFMSIIVGTATILGLCGKLVRVGNSICCPLDGRRTVSGFFYAICPAITDAIQGIWNVLSTSLLRWQASTRPSDAGGTNSNVGTSRRPKRQWLWGKRALEHGGDSDTTIHAADLSDDDLEKYHDNWESLPLRRIPEEFKDMAQSTDPTVDSSDANHLCRLLFKSHLADERNRRTWIRVDTPPIVRSSTRANTMGALAAAAVARDRLLEDQGPTVATDERPLYPPLPTVETGTRTHPLPAASPTAPAEDSLAPNARSEEETRRQALEIANGIMRYHQRNPSGNTTTGVNTTGDPPTDSDKD